MRTRNAIFIYIIYYFLAFLLFFPLFIYFVCQEPRRRRYSSFDSQGEAPAQPRQRPAHVFDWTKEDVYEWMVQTERARFADALLEEQVDGQALVALEYGDFLRYGAIDEQVRVPWARDIAVLPDGDYRSLPVHQVREI